MNRHILSLNVLLLVSAFSYAGEDTVCFKGVLLNDRKYYNEMNTLAQKYAHPKWAYSDQSIKDGITSYEDQLNQLQDITQQLQNASFYEDEFFEKIKFNHDIIQLKEQTNNANEKIANSIQNHRQKAFWRKFIYAPTSALVGVLSFCIAFDHWFNRGSIFVNNAYSSIGLTLLGLGGFKGSYELWKSSKQHTQYQHEKEIFFNKHKKAKELVNSININKIKLSKRPEKNEENH